MMVAAEAISDTEGVPFDRTQRTLVYQRAKRVRDAVPFGTQEDVYKVGYEWVNHSFGRSMSTPMRCASRWTGRSESGERSSRYRGEHV
jgi:hypothetical protein